MWLDAESVRVSLCLRQKALIVTVGLVYWDSTGVQGAIRLVVRGKQNAAFLCAETSSRVTTLGTHVS